MQIIGGALRVNEVQDNHVAPLLYYTVPVQHERVQRGAGGPDLPRKSQVGICFLKQYWYGPPRETIGPLGPNCFSKEVCTPPPVKYHID